MTVIADGKSSQAPDGKLPAASILDSKGIVLNKEDRVSVEKDGSQTILRVRRVTHGEETRTETVPFSTQTIIDPTLAPGQTVIRQEGSNGEIQRVFDVTYVDGVPESETLISETTTVIAIDQIIAVGPEDMDSPDDTSHGQANAGSNTQAQPETDAPSTQQPSDTTGGSSSGSGSGSGSGSSSGGSSSGGSSSGGSSQTPPSDNTGNGSGGNSGLVWLWNHESSWLWYADNPGSDAYGIPQALPGSKMGPGWQDDGAVQIDWGLSYIAQRYGSPTQAVAWWQQNNWY